MAGLGLLAAWWAPMFAGAISFVLYETLSPHHNDRRAIGRPHTVAEDLRFKYESHPFLLDPQLEGRVRSCFPDSKLRGKSPHVVMLSDEIGTWMYDLAKPAEVELADSEKVDKLLAEILEALPGAVQKKDKEGIIGKSGKRARLFDTTHSKEEMDKFMGWAMDVVTVKVLDGGKVVCPPQ